MTEQTVETEQQFLGNASYVAPRVVAPGGTVPVPPLPSGAAPVFELLDQLQAQQGEALNIVKQHYVPNAHHTRPRWSPVDDVEVAALVRKSISANKLLAIAKAESINAETALQLALGVEDEATVAAHEAELALRDFTRKDTGL